MDESSTIDEVAEWVRTTLQSKNESLQVAEIVDGFRSQEVDGYALLCLARSSTFEADYSLLLESIRSSDTKVPISFGHRMKLKSAIRGLIAEIPGLPPVGKSGSATPVDVSPPKSDVKGLETSLNPLALESKSIEVNDALRTSESWSKSVDTSEPEVSFQYITVDRNTPAKITLKRSVATLAELKGAIARAEGFDLPRLPHQAHPVLPISAVTHSAGEGIDEGDFDWWSVHVRVEGSPVDLASLMISNQSVSPRPNSPQLFMRIGDAVCRGETLGDLKARLAAVTGISVAFQRLSFAGQILQPDSAPLRPMGLGPGCRLSLQVVDCPMQVFVRDVSGDSLLVGLAGAFHASAVVHLAAARMRLAPSQVRFWYAGKNLTAESEGTAAEYGLNHECTLLAHARLAADKDPFNSDGLRVDLYTGRHAVREGVQGGAAGAADYWGFSPGQILYAVIYRAPSAGSGGERRGWSTTFDDGEDVNPPQAPQTARGRGVLLSCLYAVSGQLAGRADEARKLLGSLRRVLPTFPPVVMAMKALIDKRQMDSGDRAVLAQACLRLLRELSLGALPSAELFESSRVLFAFLFTTGDPDDAATRDIKNISMFDLHCSLTHGRLQDPVRVRGHPAYPGVYERRALLELFTTVPKDDAQASLEDCPSDALRTDMIEPADDVSLLLRALPQVEEAMVWDPQPSSMPFQPLLSWDWGLLSRRVKEVEYVRVVSPLSLLHAPTPCLTRNQAGTLCVKVARGGHSGGGSDVELYLPLQRQVESHDVHVLAQAVSSKGGADPAEEVDALLPACDEAIVVLLDVSASMNGPSGFAGEERDDEGSGEWEWDEAGWEEVGTEAERERELLRLIEAVRQLPYFSYLSTLAREKGAPMTVVLEELCLLCVGGDRNAARSTPLFRAISAAASRFVTLFLQPPPCAPPLRQGAAGALAGATNDDEEKLPPNFLCSISGGVMQDPVVAVDGHTYEREAMLRWFNECSSAGRMVNSPMTGEPLADQRLLPNHNLRSQIQAWLTSGPAQSIAEDVVGVAAMQTSSSSCPARIRLTIQTVPVVTPSFTLDVEAGTTGAALAARCELLILRVTSGATAGRGLVMSSCGRRLNASDIVTARLREGDVVTVHLIASLAAKTVSLENGYDAASTVPRVHLSVRHDELLSTLLARIWLVLGKRPSKVSIHTNCSDIGDGWVGSTKLYPAKRNQRSHVPTWRSGVQLSQELATSMLSKSSDSGVIKLSIFKESRATSSLSRLETVKQLFHAFVNRSEAYGYAHAIGLVCFGSRAEVRCELTPLFESFREKVDSAGAEGDTCLYDAFLLAVGMLRKYAETRPKCIQRILCLSDGEDTASKMPVHKVAQELGRSRVTLDAVCIGNSDFTELRGLARSTGGYCFRPLRLKDALKLNELETLLSARERPQKVDQSPVLQSGWDFTTFASSQQFFDVCDEWRVPPRKGMPSMVRPVCELSLAQGLPPALSAAQDSHDSSGACSTLTTVETTGSTSPPAVGNEKLGAAAAKCVIQQLKKLLQRPHPAFDVYPCEEDISFWQVVLCGPESTVYRNGTFLLYVKFPITFPSLPPDVRFVTPIRHCNINSQGRICHSIFSRDWSPDTPISAVFDQLQMSAFVLEVYGLLLSPDTHDPLDSTLALSYFESTGAYEAAVIQSVWIHASRSRDEWRVRLTSLGLPPEERLRLATVKEQEADCLVADENHASALKTYRVAAAYLDEFPNVSQSPSKLVEAPAAKRLRTLMGGFSSPTANIITFGVALGRLLFKSALVAEKLGLDLEAYRLAHQAEASLDEQHAECQARPRKSNAGQFQVIGAQTRHDESRLTDKLRYSVVSARSLSRIFTDSKADEVSLLLLYQRLFGDDGQAANSNEDEHANHGSRLRMLLDGVLRKLMIQSSGFKFLPNMDSGLLTELDAAKAQLRAALEGGGP